MATECLQGFVDAYFKKMPDPTIDYSTATDVYSLGLAFATILRLRDSKTFYKTAQTNFAPHTVAEFTSETFKNNTVFSDEALRGEVTTLLKAMTSANPEDRPTLSELEASLTKIMEKMNDDPRFS